MYKSCFLSFSFQFFPFFRLQRKKFTFKRNISLFFRFWETGGTKKDPMQSTHQVFFSPFLKVFLKREFK